MNQPNLRSRFIALSIGVLCLVAVPPTQAKDPPAHSAVKPEARGGWWMKRHQGFNDRVKKGNVDLLFIGDSITQGWEGQGSSKIWNEFYGKRNAVNLGISGDQTQHVLWRLDHGNVEGIKPKLAVLMIGTNNSGGNTSEQIADGVKAVVEILRAKLPDTKVLVLAIFPRGPNDQDKLRQKVDGANKEIAKLADDKMVFFLDIGPKFLDADGKTLSKDVMPDLLHLNDKSYRTWAESIEPKVKELMGE